MVAAFRVTRSAHGEMEEADWLRLQTDPDFEDIRATIEVQYAKRVAVLRTMGRMGHDLRGRDNRSDQEKVEAFVATVKTGADACRERHRAISDDLPTQQPDHSPYSDAAFRGKGVS